MGTEDAGWSHGFDRQRGLMTSSVWTNDTPSRDWREN